MPFRNRAAERYQKHEARVASDHSKGQLVPNSGRVKGLPGDVSFPGCLVDAKIAEKSYTLNKKVLGKISREAYSKGKMPVLQLDLESMPPGQQRWGIVPWAAVLDWLESEGL